MRWLLITLCLVAGPVLSDPAPYRLIEDRSRVAFTWFFGQDRITGDMPVSQADIVLDFDRPANSRVFVAVNASRARAGAPLAGEAMKGQSVLWTDRFPEITFRSRTVRRDGAGGAVITGTLTVRGVAQPQTFRARLFRPASAAPGDRSELTVRLDGSLSRNAFGASGYANFVGDEVILDIQAFVVQVE